MKNDSGDPTKTNPNEAATLLEDLYNRGAAIDVDGELRPTSSGVPQEGAAALTQLVAELQPKTVVEVGLACGYSSLAVLSSLPAGSQLISIDPFQHNYYGIGLEVVKRSGRLDSHRHIAAPSHQAFVQLMDEGIEIDLAYIDGMHTFDYVTVDWFLADKLLCVGGVVGFNDCGWRAVHRSIRLLKVSRDYEEIDVGLQRNFGGRNTAASVAKRLTGRSSADRYFRKRSDWEPDYSSYRRF